MGTFHWTKNLGLRFWKFPVGNGTTLQVSQVPSSQVTGSPVLRFLLLDPGFPVDHQFPATGLPVAQFLAPGSQGIR